MEVICLYAKAKIWRPTSAASLKSAARRRKERGATPAQVEEATDGELSADFLNSIIRSELKVMTLGDLNRLSEGLHVPYSDINDGAARYYGKNNLGYSGFRCGYGIDLDDDDVDQEAAKEIKHLRLLVREEVKKQKRIEEQPLHPGAKTFAESKKDDIR